MLKTVQWEAGVLKLIDQTRLPLELSMVECHTHEEVARAIKHMVVRGAPAIGVTAAYGLALAAFNFEHGSRDELIVSLKTAADSLRRTRPTAVNLVWALQRVLRVAESADGDVAAIRDAVLAEANRLAREDEECNRRIGAWGVELVEDGDTILTHCNAGALATVSYGTALGVIRAAAEKGKRVHVFVDETRPFLQGARLTAWELQVAGIPATLITDNMAGYFMSQGRINLVIVGADRIAANGDVANKIGTYSIAVLAKEHGIPFYVAAPTSTIDLATASGAAIPIEERDEREVLYINGVRIAPEGVNAANPAFDVTPARYVTAIVTENGIVRPPFEQGLERVVRANEVKAVNEIQD